MTLSGTNLDLGQLFNRRLVLETLRLGGRLSRADIARQTGLAVQTISNITEDLRRADLIIEGGFRRGGRGKPPIDLSINPAGGYSIGISFDHSRLVAVLVNLAGEILGQTELPISHPAPNVVLPLIEAAVRELTNNTAIPTDRLWGVGVVIPAILENGHPVVLGPSSIPAWEGFPLTEQLQARLDLPVLVDNNANAAAIGERLYGVGRALQDFFYIHLGAGVGGGTIAAGKPLRGARGRAGEVGHVVVAPGGRPCACGNRGCLERYLSVSAAQAALTGKPEHAEPLDLALLAEAHAAGDKRLEAWIGEAASHLRLAISTIENLLDPETIIIGGLMPRPILDALVEAVEPLPRTIASRRASSLPRLIKAQVGLETPALGSASLVIFESMSPDHTLLSRTTAPAALSAH